MIPAASLAPGSRSGRRTLQRLCPMVVLLWTFLRSVGLQSEDYTEYDCEIQGDITEARSLKEGRVDYRATHSFTVWIKGRKWFIRTAPHDPTGPGSCYQYNETGSDGTNCFYVRMTNPGYDNFAAWQSTIAFLEQHLSNSSLGIKDRESLSNEICQLKATAPSVRIPSKAINQAIGEINPCPYPCYEWGMAAPLWLAYCSHGYLDDLKHQALPLMWTLDHPSRLFSNNTVRAEIRRGPWPPYLPLKASLYDSGTYYSGEDENPHLKSRLPPFDQGYVSAIYEATLSTRDPASRLAIPSSFTLKSFVPHANAVTSNDTRVLVQFEAVTKDIRFPCSRQSFIPYLPSVTAIQDNRSFAGQKPGSVAYVAASGPWLRSNDLKTMQRFQDNLRRDYELRRRRIRLLVMSGLAAIIIVPFFVLCKKHMHVTNPHINAH